MKMPHVQESVTSLLINNSLKLHISQNRLVCNGNTDCTFSEDEKNCTTCLNDSSQFACNQSSGYPCIDVSSVCDGTQDCPITNRDELNCDCFGDPLRFPCDAQLGYPCVPNDSVCNGTTECENGRDEEMGCSCSEEFQFTCRDGTCIPIAERCDGKYGDCTDNSDEIGCGM